MLPLLVELTAPATPSFDRDTGAYLDYGIPAPVVAQYLRENRVVPEKNDLNSLLFLLTGSAVLPLQALVCNVLSLTAAFGAMAWIFQDGHLGAFGTTPNGTLNANIPVLLFCIAFGLAMDYEVFLVSRIHEYWVASEATREILPGPAVARAANDESVAHSLAVMLL